MSFKPVGQVEKDVFELWKELSPSDAFVGGLREYAGRMAIPERPHMELLTRRIDELSMKTESKAQQRLLASLKMYGIQLGFMGEAQIVPDMAISIFFAHLVKEGVVLDHLESLADQVGKALAAYSTDSLSGSCASGVKILTSIRCVGLIEVADTIKKQTRSRRLQSALNSMIVSVNDYSKRFGVTDFKNSGFDEIVEICRREGCDLGREDYYADALRELFDYSESPTELEDKGLTMLGRELADFKREVAELAAKLDVEATAEAVSHMISKKKALKPDKVVGCIKGLKQYVPKLLGNKIVRMNSRYRTKVVETPTYLSGIFPSGGAMFFDFLTKRPFQIFMATTDPRRAPETSPAELLNLLIHEEYGHCLHSSNSVMSFGAKPTLTDMLQSPAGNAVSEGISFHRELEFLNYINGLNEREPTPRERAFMKFLAKYGGSDEVFEEYEFFTHLWRIVRFLRVIGDARMNSGTQNLMDFIDWANRETGLSKSLVYHQVFPAHQGIGPGYASTYAILGQSVATIQQEALRNGKTLINFNTYACSLGFPPRSIFEEKLRSYATS